MAAIKQDVNAPLILTIGVVSGLLLLVIVFGLEAWFVREETTEIDGKWKRSKCSGLPAHASASAKTCPRTAPWKSARAKSNGCLRL